MSSVSSVLVANFLEEWWDGEVLGRLEVAELECEAVVLVFEAVFEADSVGGAWFSDIFLVGKIFEWGSFDWLRVVDASLFCLL